MPGLVKKRAGTIGRSRPSPPARRSGILAHVACSACEQCAPPRCFIAGRTEGSPSAVWGSGSLAFERQDRAVGEVSVDGV